MTRMTKAQAQAMRMPGHSRRRNEYRKFYDAMRPRRYDESRHDFVAWHRSLAITQNAPIFRAALSAA